jgi:hypothetical protein
MARAKRHYILGWALETINTFLWDQPIGWLRIYRQPPPLIGQFLICYSGPTPGPIGFAELTDKLLLVNITSTFGVAI